MSGTAGPLRADARRNRERIMASAGELFASQGRAAQMEDIAAHAGLGIGTLYRHFPHKQALLTAIAGVRFAGMAELAAAAENVPDPGEAFETLLRRYLEAAEGDAGFQLALMGSEELDTADLEPHKRDFGEIVARIIDRAVATGAVRADLTVADFPLLTCGAIAAMYFAPGGTNDWRRHLELTLHGIRTGRDDPTTDPSPDDHTTP